MTEIKRGKKLKNSEQPCQAEQADKFVCYQRSVQEPDHEVRVFDQVYREAYNIKPLTLREDFCGTFAVSCEWAKSDKNRQAVGLDICPETLAWGIENNLGKLKTKVAERVEVLEQDARSRTAPHVDVLAAQNFSFWCLKTRQEVVNYFKLAFENLGEKGVMVMDMMGGKECYASDVTDKRTIIKGKDGFKYHWEQAYFNPVSADCSFYIHFKFADGSMIKKAFEYHWRFWTIPEVREMLAQAGFRVSKVYWDIADEDEDADWQAVDEAPNDDSWLCYVVGIK
ncbi:MAG: hypothetical protein CMD92_03345 [Gammaproteobacteria bacterium]|nr:hypothetical protein [Gammaproteobacteria bacterium]HBW85047.1 hypothetical protein [Gammaproteobacteria bacterium]|tara:strand:- start:10994 stop:11839 length:846 start_codon:yes stop_codon:yes gene_type:complete